MAGRKNNSQTAVSIVVVAVVGYLLYKFLPGLLKGSGSSAQQRYAGGGITSGSQPYRPPQPSQQQSKGSPSGISGGGSAPRQPSGASFPSSGGFGQWLYNLTRNQTLAQDGPLSFDNFQGAAGYSSPSLDNFQFPTDPLQLLNLQGTDIADPNMLSESDYTDLVGSTGPDANSGDYLVSPDFSSIDTSYDPSLDSFQFDPSFDAGGGGYSDPVDYSYSDSGYADTYSPDLGGDAYIN
jgi:hypothetical protein